MPNSEEYLASLGFDLTDLNRDANRAIDVLGHLAAVYDRDSKAFEAAQERLKKVGEAAATAAKKQASASGAKIPTPGASGGGNAAGSAAAAGGADKHSDALARNSAEIKKNSGNLITQRYALYDVASTYSVVSTALLAAGGYAIAMGAKFETAFTGVERTISNPQGVASGIEGIRRQLVDLSSQIPLTFEQLSSIATLGNQLGVEAKDLTTFTETIAKFSAVSGMSVEASAQAFGTIGNLLGISAAQYNNLGSAIELVGINSVATDAQIISVTEQISAGARGAGFAAEEVVGLAGALASLKVAPEQARGSLSIYFSALNKAVAHGGDELQNFATITGYTGEQLDKMVRSGKGGNEVLSAFLKGLSSGDTVQVTTALDALGLSQVRVDNTFRRLAQSTELYAQTQRDAAQGYGQGTELSRQFGMVVDNLASQFQMLVNNINGLIESISGGMVPGIAGVLGGLNSFVSFLREIADNHAAQTLGQIAIIFGLVAGAMLAVRVAGILATASTYALFTANQALAASNVRGGIFGLAQMMLGLNTGARTAAGGTAVLTGSLRLLGRVALIGFIVEAVTLLSELASGSKDAANTIAGAAGFLIDVVGSVMTAFANVRNFLTTLGDPLALMQGSSQLQLDTGRQQYMDDLQVGIAKSKGMVADWAAGFKDAKDGIDNVAGAMPEIPWGEMGAGLGGTTDGLNDMGDAANEAAQEVRTLVDYAADISGVLARAFDIRYGGSQALDAIATSWNSIRSAAADARQQIVEYQATMSQLTADKAVRQYWLQVAQGFGNNLRAGEIGADIADINSKMSKTSADLAAEQAKLSGTTRGNSQAAIDNRGALLGLVGQYNSYIEKLAGAGLSQDEMKKKVDELKTTFIKQATQLGYNRDDVLKYAASFDDARIAIDRVPKNITVHGNVNPALQALAELEAKARSLAGKKFAGPTMGAMTGGGVSKGVEDMLFFDFLKKMSDQFHRSMYQSPGQLAQLRRSWESGAFNGFYKGGWTGGTGKHDIAGVVHGQEFVLNNKGAQMFPRQMLDAANKGQSPFYAGAQKAKPVGPGMGLMELGPTSLGVLRQIVAKEMAVYVGDREVAEAARRGNAQFASEGSY